MGDGKPLKGSYLGGLEEEITYFKLSSSAGAAYYLLVGGLFAYFSSLLDLYYDWSSSNL